jgi:hypothetical protein
LPYPLLRAGKKQLEEVRARRRIIDKEFLAEKESQLIIASSPRLTCLFAWMIVYFASGTACIVRRANLALLDDVLLMIPELF